MIEYIVGDATQPKCECNKLIIHCCNDRGAWGAGFVIALSNRWPQPEFQYRRWFGGSSEGVEVYSDDGKNGFHLGAIQVVDVEDDIAVVNMVGQHNTGRDKLGHPPIRYYAIDECLKKVAKVAMQRKATIHCPRFGCGLAGGEWDVIEKFMELRLGNIRTTVYDFK